MEISGDPVVSLYAVSLQNVRLLRDGKKKIKNIHDNSKTVKIK